MVVRAVVLPVVFWVMTLAVVRLAVVPPKSCSDASPSEMRAVR